MLCIETLDAWGCEYIFCTNYNPLIERDCKTIVFMKCAGLLHKIRHRERAQRVRIIFTIAPICPKVIDQIDTDHALRGMDKKGVKRMVISFQIGNY